MKKVFKPAIAKRIDSTNKTIDFVLTSKNVDRDGEVVLPKGVDLENFKTNPVFLWAHNRTAGREAAPLGRVIPESLKATENQLTGTVEFDADDEFAMLIFGKYEKGMLNAGSIGFYPKEADRPILDGQRGNTYTKSELLEFSAVPIPSNPMALARAKGASDLREWAETVKEFFTDPENEKLDAAEWCSFLTEKSILSEKDAETSDDKDSKEKADPDVISATTEPKSKSLPPIIDNVLGSYERIARQLSASARSWLIESGIDVRIYDHIMTIATFQKEALVLVMAPDRAYLDDEVYRGSYKMSGNLPSWKGEPTLVRLEAQIVEEVRSMTEDIKSKMQMSVSGVVPSGEKSDLISRTNYDSEQVLKKVRSFAALPLVAADFDNPAFRRRYAKAFAFVKGEGTSADDYLFLHHTVADGQLVPSWKHLAESMIALSELAPGTEFSKDDLHGIYRHLAEHYAEFNEEAPQIFEDFEDKKKCPACFADIDPTEGVSDADTDNIEATDAHVEAAIELMVAERIESGALN